MSCIKSKKELKFYIAADRMMNRGTFKESYKDKIKNLIVPDYIMAYLKSMREVSYYKWRYTRAYPHTVQMYFYLFKLTLSIRKFKCLGAKLGITIGNNVFGYGLVMPHYGTIVVGESNNIGNYAVLHTSTCISSNGKIIGNGLYLSTGAKITSKVILGDNVSIGANSVVNKSYKEDNIMIAGVPAKYIKNKEPWYTLDSTYMQRYKAVEYLKQKMNIN